MNIFDDYLGWYAWYRRLRGGVWNCCVWKTHDDTLECYVSEAGWLRGSVIGKCYKTETYP